MAAHSLYDGSMLRLTSTVNLGVTDTQTENITFPHPKDAGGKKGIKVMTGGEKTFLSSTNILKYFKQESPST